MGKAQGRCRRCGRWRTASKERDKRQADVGIGIGHRQSRGGLGGLRKWNGARTRRREAGKAGGH